MAQVRKARKKPGKTSKYKNPTPKMPKEGKTAMRKKSVDSGSAFRSRVSSGPGRIVTGKQGRLQ